MIDYKYRLVQLNKKIKNNIDNSMKSVKKFTNTYKRVIGTGLCAATLLTVVIHSDIINAESTASSNLETIYHVYVDGDRVGTVDDDKKVEQIEKELINEYQKNYDDLNFTLGVDVKIIPELVFKSNANNALTLKNLENKISVKAEAIALIVDREPVAYVNTLEDYEKVMKQLKLQYVTEDELAKASQFKADSFSFDELQVGENIISDVKLSKQIHNEKSAVNPKDILTTKEAIKKLNLGTLKDDIYTVKKGDVLGTIAEAHQLSTEEILALNPNITENTLLQIGAELNVTVYKPIVKVVVNQVKKVQEEIPFETEIKEDANMWRGDTKVQQKGQKGERVVSYSIAQENGRTIEKNVETEEVLKEPVNKIILKGTKVSPSRGTGRLAWPTVGGYISSYQGQRWGRFHKGLDIARPSNRNILAADNGTVTFAGWNGGYGNQVVINHNNGMRTEYSHLSSINVRVGQTIGRGQKIGVMGTTGNSTGVHLHIEVYKNGQLQNPLDYLNR